MRKKKTQKKKRRKKERKKKAREKERKKEKNTLFEVSDCAPVGGSLAISLDIFPFVRSSLAVLNSVEGTAVIWCFGWILTRILTFLKGTWQSREPRGLGIQGCEYLPYLWYQLSLWTRPPLLILLWVSVSLLKNRKWDYWCSCFVTCYAAHGTTSNTNRPRFKTQLCHFQLCDLGQMVWSRCTSSSVYWRYLQCFIICILEIILVWNRVKAARLLTKTFIHINS